MKVLFTIIGIFFFTSASFAEEILISQETNQKNEIALLKLEQKANTIIQDAENKIEILEYKQKEIVLEKETLKNNTEREWNLLSDRWAWLDWVVAIFSILLALAGFVGWRKWEKITKKLEQADEKAEEELASIEKTKKDIEAQAENIKKAQIQIDENQKSIEKTKNEVEEMKKEADQILEVLSQNAENITEKSAEDWFIIGLNYQNNENYEEAIKAYKESIKITKSEGAYNNLGNIYLKKKNYEEAIKYYEKSIKITKTEIAYTNLGVAYNNLGIASAKQENYEEAIEKFKKAIEFNPNNYSAYCNLARAYSLQKDYENAKKYLEETKKRMNPFNAEKFENDKDFDNLRKAEPEWWKNFLK